jgi:hypothetical protein
MAGLTFWLTATAGIEYINDTLYTKPIGSLSLSSWLDKNYVFTVDAAPGALYRADLSAVYASQVSADLSATKHEKNEYYNPSHIITEEQTTMSLPLKLSSALITYQFQVNRQNYEYSTATLMATGATASYKQINGTIEYRYVKSTSGFNATTREPVLSSSILYSLSPNRKFASLTTNILVGSSFIYDLERKKAGELRLDLSSNVTASGRVQLSYTRNFVQNLYLASIQFVYEFPFTRYNINIDGSSISNPLWMPKSYAFSAITDPNIFKPIDVPFYATGVLEGSVFMQTGTKQEAIPGIDLRIQSIDGKYAKDICVFADGSFYEMGVPPDKYIAYVDSAQLSILGVSCDPPIRSFEVKITANGDYVEGMKFLLKKR